MGWRWGRERCELANGASGTALSSTYTSQLLAHLVIRANTNNVVGSPMARHGYNVEPIHPIVRMIEL